MKKKEKGFTIIELLAVIIVLAVLMVLVAPSLFSSQDKARMKAFQTKASTIETEATIFGQDFYGAIVAEQTSTKCTYSDFGDDHYCELKVKDLVPKYVQPDNENATNMVEDPRNKAWFLDECTVTIKINTRTRTVESTFNIEACNAE